MRNKEGGDELIGDEGDVAPLITEYLYDMMDFKNDRGHKTLVNTKDGLVLLEYQRYNYKELKDFPMRIQHKRINIMKYIRNYEGENIVAQTLKPYKFSEYLIYLRRFLADEVNLTRYGATATTESAIEDSDYWTALRDAIDWTKGKTDAAAAFTTMKDAIKDNKFKGWTDLWVSQQRSIKWGEAGGGEEEYDAVFAVLDPLILKS